MTGERITPEPQQGPGIHALGTYSDVMTRIADRAARCLDPKDKTPKEREEDLKSGVGFGHSAATEADKEKLEKIKKKREEEGRNNN